MKPLIGVVSIVLFPLTAFATCLSVPAPGVPRFQRQAVAYSVAFKAGHDEVPLDPQGHQVGQSKTDDICFQTFDPTGIVTDAAMLTQYTQDEADRQAAATSEQTRQSGFETEVTSNNFCTAELSDIDARITTLHDTLTTAITSASTVNQIKTAMTNLNDTYATALKKVARCIRARAR